MYHKFVYNVEPLKLRRKDLRKKSTVAEKILWERIRNNQLGFKFFRQYSVEGFVTDFYCPKKRLAIELEGKIHLKKDQQNYDKYRFAYLKAYNIKILRFSNDEIYLKIGTAIGRIKKELSSPS